MQKIKLNGESEASLSYMRSWREKREERRQGGMEEGRERGRVEGREREKGEGRIQLLCVSQENLLKKWGYAG